MDFERFLRDYSIHFAGPGERHYRAGWINMPCPFCYGNAGNHLGYNIFGDYAVCHRCGGKSQVKVIQKILNIKYYQAIDILRKYRGSSKGRIKSLGIQVNKVAFRFPDDLGPLSKSKMAMRYMRKDRKHFSLIDIMWLQKRYGLQATGSEGLFFYGEKQLDLSYRILAPILFDYEVVTWQTRDFAGRNSKIKYMACPEQVEKIHHKHILYNPPDPNDYRFIILCEGIFDVWKCRLAGFPATCFFGVKYTSQQFRALLDYDRVLVLFDPDKAGDASCKQLRRQLLFAGKRISFIENMLVDPGDMAKNDIYEMINPLWQALVA